MVKHVRKRRKTEKKPFKIWYVILAIIIIIIIAVIALISSIDDFMTLKASPSPMPKYSSEQLNSVLGSENIYDNIYIDDIHLGSKSIDDANRILNRFYQEYLDDILINVSIKNETITFGYEDMDVTSNFKELTLVAHNIGRSGDKEKDYETIIALRENPMLLYTKTTIEPLPIKPMVENLLLKYTINPESATILEFNPDPKADMHFVISSEIVGKIPNKEKLWQDIQIMVKDEDWGSIVVAAQTVQPEFTRKDLIVNTSLIVKFETTMSNTPNRISNIKLCSSQINGLIVPANESFSINETTGYRSEAAGYLNATVIQNGNELTEGLAGGICQVSGTLYNAMVRANMQILERHHHSFELSYLKRGRDATLEYKGKDPWTYDSSEYDLKGKNNTKYPMYILMYTDRLKVISEIYGQSLPDGQRIDIDVKTTKTIKPGGTKYIADEKILAGGEPKVNNPRTGIRCTSYRVFYDLEDKEVKREKLYDDYYRPFAKEIYVNPADMPGMATAEPTASPTVSPTAEPTTSPTAEPTSSPTAEPTASPTAEPIVSPTAEPTAEPTIAPTIEPTSEP